MEKARRGLDEKVVALNWRRDFDVQEKSFVRKEEENIQEGLSSLLFH